TDEEPVINGWVPERGTYEPMSRRRGARGRGRRSITVNELKTALTGREAGAPAERRLPRRGSRAAPWPRAACRTAWNRSRPIDSCSTCSSDASHHRRVARGWAARQIEHPSFGALLRAVRVLAAGALLHRRAVRADASSRR